MVGRHLTISSPFGGTWPVRLVGLGRHPLTVRTGVQIPHGSHLSHSSSLAKDLRLSLGRRRFKSGMRRYRERAASKQHRTQLGGMTGAPAVFWCTTPPPRDLVPTLRTLVTGVQLSPGVPPLRLQGEDGRLISAWRGFKHLRSDKTHRRVAQPGSAPVWGTGGRRFKSCHADDRGWRPGWSD